MLACEGSISSTGTVLHRKNWERSNLLIGAPSTAVRRAPPRPAEGDIASVSGLPHGGSRTGAPHAARKGNVFLPPTLKQTYLHNDSQRKCRCGSTESAEEPAPRLLYSNTPRDKTAVGNPTAILPQNHRCNAGIFYGGGGNVGKDNICSGSSAAKRPPSGRRAVRTTSCRVVGGCDDAAATTAAVAESSADQRESCCEQFFCSDRFQEWLEEWRRHSTTGHCLNGMGAPMVDVAIQCNAVDLLEATTGLYSSRTIKKSKVTSISDFLSPLSTAATTTADATAQRAPSPRAFIYTTTSDAAPQSGGRRGPSSASLNVKQSTMQKRRPLSVSQIFANGGEGTELDDDDLPQPSSSCLSFDKSSGDAGQCWLFDHSYVYLEGNMGNDVGGNENRLSATKRSISCRKESSTANVLLMENSLRSRLTASTQTDASSEGAMYRRASYLEEYALERLRQMNKEAISRARQSGRARRAVRCVWDVMVAAVRRLRVWLTTVLDARPRRQMPLPKTSRKMSSSEMFNPAEDTLRDVYQLRQKENFPLAGLFAASKANGDSVIDNGSMFPAEHRNGVTKCTSKHTQKTSMKQKNATEKRKRKVVDSKETTIRDDGTPLHFHSQSRAATPNSERWMTFIPEESRSKLRVATENPTPMTTTSRKQSRKQRKDDDSLLVVTCFV